MHASPARGFSGWRVIRYWEVVLVVAPERWFVLCLPACCNNSWRTVICVPLAASHVMDSSICSMLPGQNGYLQTFDSIKYVKLRAHGPMPIPAEIQRSSGTGGPSRA